MTDDIDRALIAAQQSVLDTQAELERAQDRRAMAFALAAEKGKTSGDIARLVGSPPNSVLFAIKTGGRLIRKRRWLDEQHRAAA